MATPENTFISGVHRHLPAGLYRMKNHNQFNSGIADVWYSGNNADLWVEYKFVVLPKRSDTPITINLSELQKNWLFSRHAEGRRVRVIVGCKEGGVWFDNLEWGIPCTSDKFKKEMMSRAEIAAHINRIVG